MPDSRFAASHAASMGIGRSIPSGTVMSWPWTNSSISGCCTLVPGTLLREPAIPRSAMAISYCDRGSSRPSRWIIESNRKPDLAASTIARTGRMCEWVR